VVGTFNSETITGSSLTCSDKDGHVRTIPVPDWVKPDVDEWLTVTCIEDGLMLP